MCDQFDHIIESFINEDSIASANVSHIPTLGDCLVLEIFLKRTGRTSNTVD